MDSACSYPWHRHLPARDRRAGRMRRRAREPAWRVVTFHGGVECGRFTATWELVSREGRSQPRVVSLRERGLALRR